MPVSIFTNVPSLTAQRNLDRTTNQLDTAITRLSSGLRINSAKDDAAGLAIATRFTTQIQGLDVAIRNANDGISITQTAEGAMNEMVSSLIRANDLALQAASYNTSQDRASLQQEVSQIQQELSRIVAQTRYNGEALLNGGFAANIQVGTEVAETIAVGISNLSPTQLGVASNFAEISADTNATLADEIRNAFDTDLASTDTIEGVAIGTTVAAQQNSINKINALNAISASTGVSAFSYGNAAVGSSDVTDANLAATAVGTGELVVNGISIDGATGLTALAANINAKSNETGVTAVVDTGAAANQSRLVLLNTTGAAITVTTSSANAAAVTGFASGSTSVDAGANGRIVLNASLGQANVTFNDTTAQQAVNGVVTGTPTTVALSDAPVNSQTVSTAAAANLALLSFQAALDTLNAERAVLGATQNRFESTINNLSNVQENITAARGRIIDADFAEETARLTRAQILQQSGIAMVAQANSIPQAALALLQ